MTKVKRFKDEEVSRVLSHAHELTRYGVQRGESVAEEYCVGCINQAAYNCGGVHDAYKKNPEVAEVFDMGPVPRTPLKMLRFLERLGAV